MININSFFVFLYIMTTYNAYAAEPDFNLQLLDNVIVKYSAPSHGITCSNMDRATRISKKLKQLSVKRSSWGPTVYIGNYKSKPIFIAYVPIGSGAGVMYSELYAAGAKYIVRYGSDDSKNPKQDEYNLIKIIDETDNLFGFNQASGVPDEEWGMPLSASRLMIEIFVKEAVLHNLPFEKRICHHLENYHALNYLHRYSQARQKKIKMHLLSLKRSDKRESFDMESAVLFRLAKDMGKHAITILQTINKEDPKFAAYEGKNRRMAIEIENTMFVDYILDALIRII